MEPSSDHMTPPLTRLIEDINIAIAPLKIPVVAIIEKVYAEGRVYCVYYTAPILVAASVVAESTIRNAY